MVFTVVAVTCGCWLLLFCRRSASRLVTCSATAAPFRLSLLAKRAAGVVTARAVFVYLAFRFFLVFFDDSRFELRTGTTSPPTRFGLVHGLSAARIGILFWTFDIFSRHGALHLCTAIRLTAATRRFVGVHDGSVVVHNFSGATASTQVRVQIAGTLAATANARNSGIAMQCRGPKILASRAQVHVVGRTVIATGATTAAAVATAGRQ